MWDVMQTHVMQTHVIRVSDVSCETWIDPAICGREVSCVWLRRSSGNDNSGESFLQNNHLCVCLMESIYISTALLLLT